MEEGEYDNGYLNGPGKRTYVHGEVHDGTFVDDELVKGTVTFPDKDVEEGGRVNGHLQGQGKRTVPGHCVEEGEYDNGYLIGPGKRTYADRVV